MEFKGTKGKWRLNANGGSIDNSYNSCVIDEDDNTICNVFYTHDNNFANAKLISKAPEMLQLLKDTYLHIDALSRKMKDPTYSQGMKGRAEQIKELIKEATEI